LKSKTIVFAVSLLAIAATVACGTGGSVILPTLSGNYSNASLKGSYVYQVHGFDSNGNPYRQIGVFTADGNGNITGGSDDSSASASGTQVSGSYTVGKDGTGFIGVNTSLGTLTWAITLSSTSQLQLIEADSFANAGGTAELQDSTAVASIPTGTFVFRVHQELSAENQAPAGEAGLLTFSSGSGTGSMDQNLAGTLTSPSISSTLNAPAGVGRGTGTLLNGSTSFTTNFVYYIVNSSKFYLLVSNISAVGSGSAELQSGAVGNGLSGSYAFGSRGDDSNSFAGVATVGQFNASSGTITGTEDCSQDGNITSSANFSSSYTSSANGRVAVTVGTGNSCLSGTATQVFWMVSPSRAFFVNAGTSSVEEGTADLQQAPPMTPASLTQQYSLAMDGVDTGAIDQTPQLLSRVGTLQFNGAGKLTLNEVSNGSFFGAGAQSPGAMSGTYSVGSSGRIVGSTSNNSGGISFVMYAASPSLAYVLQTDQSLITSGMMQLQQ
jgi:hypothetical protein